MNLGEFRGGALFLDFATIGRSRNRILSCDNHQDHYAISLRPHSNNRTFRVAAHRLATLSF